MARKSISFTEIADWKTCRQRWAWKYQEGLKPIRYSEKIRIGTIAHALMEAYLKGDDALRRLREVKAEITPEGAFAEEIDEIDRIGDLAKEVVDNYAFKNPLYAAGSEIPFAIKIPHTVTTLKGVIDAFTEAPGSNALWLTEFKFPQRFRAEEDLELSTQLLTYLWMGRQLGYNLAGVRYIQILPRIPEVPDQNKNGTTSRREIYTDWETYSRTVRERGEDPENYREEMVPKLEGKEFWKEFRLYRTPAQVDHYIQQLQHVARDIGAKRKRIYPCENAIHCGGCAYRNLCLEVARGKDPRPLIESGFIRRTYNETASSTTANGADQFDTFGE